MKNIIYPAYLELFPNENVACFYATRMENIYQDSLGKVESVAFHELI